MDANMKLFFIWNKGEQSVRGTSVSEKPHKGS